MAMASGVDTASSTTQTEKTTNKIPSVINEMLDIAIFSFASVSGLRASNKLRGNPVLTGICCFFGSLLACAKEETKATFSELAPGRLGGWSPGKEPTDEILTLISSRIKAWKRNNNIREESNPVAPDTLYDKTQSFNEVTERLTTKKSPVCWRCKSKCRFCLLRKKNKKIMPLRSELLSPFLGVMDDMAGDIPFQSDDGMSDGETQLPDGIEEISPEDAEELIERCLSGEVFSEDEEEADEEEGEEEEEEDEDEDDLNNE